MRTEERERSIAEMLAENVKKARAEAEILGDRYEALHDAYHKAGDEWTDALARLREAEAALAEAEQSAQ